VSITTEKGKGKARARARGARAKINADRMRECVAGCLLAAVMLAVLLECANGIPQTTQRFGMPERMFTWETGNSRRLYDPISQGQLPLAARNPGGKGSPGSKEVYIKLYGERNSGTTYLGQLLYKNFGSEFTESWDMRNWFLLRGSADNGRPDEFFRDTFRYNLGWKHMLVLDKYIRPVLKPDICYFFVFVNKNPYAWFRSMFDQPYHYGARKPPTLAGFLEHSYKTAGWREGATKPRFATPMELYNDKHKAHMEFSLPKLIFKYTELLVDPEQCIQRIKNAIVHECKVDEPRNFKFRPMGDEEKVVGKALHPKKYYLHKYLDESWKDIYRKNPKMLTYINERLDLDLVRDMGYEVLRQEELDRDGLI
jgi:hypothetical protein